MSEEVEEVTKAAARPGVSERPISGANGVTMLFVAAVLMLAGLALVIIGADGVTGGLIAVLVVAGILLCVAGFLAFFGLTPIAPGQARVVQLFGRYVGTGRTTGLRWFNPLTVRRIVSTRIRNHETGTTKVNDADGNPVEISAVVVWRVQDTARAVYEVDNFIKFVDIQAETAVRHVVANYPYDAHHEGQMSLRDNADEFTSRLSEEIAARVDSAGVRVIESRLTRLAYAPEIAQAMLRRQQAGAVVAARQRIVEGAVGMVQLALERLDEQNVIDLDEERKATMVSNLLVVLCSDHATQPVVNTGTLYQ